MTEPGDHHDDSVVDETTLDLTLLAEPDEEGKTPSTPEGLATVQVPPVEANIILIAHPENKMLGQRFQIAPRGSLLIGRAPESDVSLPDVRSISRLHARLHHLGGIVELEDLGSTNGTFVNNAPVRSRKVLASGDRFQVGAVHFKLLHEEDPEHAYHEAIYHLVVRDGLTQCFNRRKLFEELSRELRRAERHERPLSLIIFDIDHFKRVNDSYGHLCGDHVLQQIARITQSFVRPEQIFARVGGEEFAILCPETTAADARTLADKVRSQIAKEVFCFGGVELQVTCSFGVAELTQEMVEPEDLYRATDQAMFDSKHGGRNRVSMYRGEG